MLNRIILFLYCLIAILFFSGCLNKKEAKFIGDAPSLDSFPTVLTIDHGNLVYGCLKHEASVKYALHRLPNNLENWKIYRQSIISKIIENTGVKRFSDLPLDMKETGTVRMSGYSIKKIIFQTRPNIYATANLYIPDGDGPFPAVIHMIGHFHQSKIGRGAPQGVGHSLALNGYVCLSVDPWGSGERTTVHGDFEYHGSNLGASLMNVGETLMGMQITDNIRGVDFLQSLPYVDKNHIGATGASGGGHQTLYLTAIDDRIKSAVPIVSIGTYEALFSRGCICNMLLNGLSFTEEAGVLALIAPRAVKMCNHIKDSSPAFYPSEMLRTFHNARPVFKMMGVEENIAFQLFDLPHGYKSEDREAMIGWFDLHLKGIGSGTPKDEIPFEFIPPDELMVFRKGQRLPEVMTTEEYCKKRGDELRNVLLNAESINLEEKKKGLRKILGMNEELHIKNIHNFSKAYGWERLAIETTDGRLVPLLIYRSSKRSEDFIILCNPEGKISISHDLIKEYIKGDYGIVLIDLSGTGELISKSYKDESHIFARSELWLGRTVLGEWANELDLAVRFLRSACKVDKIHIDAVKEAGLSSLFLCALKDCADELTLRDLPVSYLFDDRETVDFFSMNIHVPGFLNWGDVSLAAALSGININFINPLTMSGNILTTSQLSEFKNEFEQMRKKCRQSGKTNFIK